MSRAAAIETLQRCAQALAGKLTRKERARMVALHEQALRLLAAPAHRPETLRLAQRAWDLEQQLSDRDPGERLQVICQRLGVSRRRAYELLGIHAECGNISALFDGGIGP